MQKNWYVIYTRPQLEKKVATFLSKKRIENFIPLVCTEVNSTRKNKIAYKPLFKSYVFVHVTEQEAKLLREAEGVINLLYWLGKPAVINETEINAIKEFTTDHRNIDLEKLTVNTSMVEANIFRPEYEIDGNVVAIKNKTIKINLPSLGYAMVANLSEDSIFARERMVQNYTFAQS